MRKNNIKPNWFDLAVVFIFGIILGLIVGGSYYQMKYLEIHSKYVTAVEIIEHIQRGK